MSIIKIKAQKNIPIAKITIRDVLNRPNGDTTCQKVLEKSIKEVGILTPIIVTEKQLEDNKNEEYILLAGYRRLAACRKLLKLFIPAVIIADTKDANTIQAVENAIREDLHPLDEAELMQRIYFENLQVESNPTKAYKKTADTFGKSVSYLRKHLALLNLIPSLKTFYKDNELSLGSALLLARETENVQKDIYQENQDRLPGSDTSFINYLIGRYHCSLDDVKFDKSECKKCEYCTSSEPDLFDDIQDSYCLNEKCYHKKETAYIEEAKRMVKVAYKEDAILLTDKYHATEPNTRGLEKPYTIVDEGETGAKPAIFIDGVSSGEVVFIKDAVSVERNPIDKEKKQKKKDALTEYGKKIGEEVGLAISNNLIPFDSFVYEILFDVCLSEMSFYTKCYLKKLYLDENSDKSIEDFIKDDIEQSLTKNETKQKWFMRIILFSCIYFDQSYFDISDKNPMGKFCSLANISYKKIKTECFKKYEVNEDD